MISKIPEPPYYAVIFTSVRTAEENGYYEMAARMQELAMLQDGFLGMETARSDIGITVSYWKDLECLKKWRENLEHSYAQQKGKEYWYRAYKVRIAKVERHYEFQR